MVPEEALAVAHVRSQRRIVRPELGHCLEYTGRTNQKGYGRIGCQGRELLVHRLAYDLAHGTALPSEVVVMHRCDNPPCFEVGHLTVGTTASNNADMAAKGRAQHRFGESNSRAKLTDDEIAEIRRRRSGGQTIHSIADLFGIHNSYVSRLARGLRRTH